MTFDIAVIPAERATTLAAARKIADALELNPIPTIEPSSALREFVDELNCLHGPDAGGLLATPAVAQAAGVLVPARWRTAQKCLRTIVAMTANRDLAVVDSWTDRLYNPRRGVAVSEFRPGGMSDVCPYITRDLLADFLSRLPDPGNPFLVLRRGDTGMQCYLGTDHRFDVEFLDNNEEGNLRMNTDNRSLVCELMWAWATDDISWRSAVTWEPFSL